jgi:RNA-binding protein
MAPFATLLLLLLRFATASANGAVRVPVQRFTAPPGHLLTARFVDLAAGDIAHRCTSALARSCHVRCCEPRAAPELTGAQRRSLRAHAGRLAVDKALRYVNVADNERSRAEVDSQLEDFELVRCKFSVAKKSEAKEMAAEMGALVGAAVAEVLGHTALLYRPSPKRLICLDN